MPVPAILIAASELLPALQTRLAGDAPGLLTFADTDALRALEVIAKTRPTLVLLERHFASTPRGAALITRIKADPALGDTEIRVVPPDGSAIDAPAAATSESRAAAGKRVPAAPPQTSAESLDYKGTRRATRHKIAGSMDILVDGNRGTVVDLSSVGVQLFSASVLKPNQRVRVSLADSHGTLRCAAMVIWATFEIPKGAAPRYRAGLEFIDADTHSIDAYARRHKQA